MSDQTDPSRLTKEQLDELLAISRNHHQKLTEAQQREVIDNAMVLPVHKRDKHRHDELPLLAASRGDKPRAFGYGRVSRPSQYDKDNSIPAQKLRIEQYYEWALKPKGVEWCDFIEDGKAVSARSVPFMSRPGGRKIMSELRQGDHLIFDKLDRMWRDLRDFCFITEWFKRNNITLHIMNLGGSTFQTNTVMGEAFLQMIAVFAQLEAETTRERIRETAAIKRSQGLSITNNPPHGVKLVPVAGSKMKRFAWDLEERRMMALIVKLREEGLMEYEEIAAELERRRREKAGLPPLSPILMKKFTSGQKSIIHHRYASEVCYRMLGLTNATKVPPKKTILAIAKDRLAEVNKMIRDKKRAMKVDAKRAS